MLGNIVNFTPCEQIQASQECFLPWLTLPLDTRYIKVKHCLLLDGPIFYSHFLPLSFPFSFPKSISWFNFFSCGFFSWSLFLFLFCHCLQLRVWRLPVQCCSQCHSAVVFLLVTSGCSHLTFLFCFWLDAVKHIHFTLPLFLFFMCSTRYTVIIKCLPT